MTAGDYSFSTEIDQLRNEIVSHVALLIIPFSMAGLFLTTAFAARADTPLSLMQLQPVILVELGILLLGFLYGWLRWMEHSATAYLLLSWGLLALSLAGVFTFPSSAGFDPLVAVWPGIACMLVALLFGPLAGWAGVAALLTCLLVLPAIRSGTAVLPIQVLAAISPAVLLVAFMQIVAHVLLRNLQWTTESYEAQRRQSYALRDQDAQLAAALKSLNQTSFALARANEQLEIMVKYAEDARNAKQEFAANISHELRVPLNLIIGFSDMIVFSAENSDRYGGFEAPPAWLADLHVVRRNAEHLLKLVNDVLDLSQMDMAYMTIVRKPTDVERFIHSALEELGPLIEHHGLALSVQVEPGLPPVYADQNRILQVLLNLVNNALRFTERGGITIRAYRLREGLAGMGRHAAQEDFPEPPGAPEHIVVSVADTGVGIPPEDLQRIFEPFIQASNTQGHAKQSGTGLGLTISKRFVELHGGRMWVESELGVGSVFSFSLPLNPPLPPSDTSTTLRTIHRRELGSLVVVERVPLMSTLLERQLEGIGVRHFQSTAELAGDLARGTLDCPEAVLFNQPGDAPPEFAQLPKPLQRLPLLQCYIPAALDNLMQYGGAGAGRVADAQLAVTPEHFLLKPFSHQQLYQAVGNLLDAPEVGRSEGLVARVLVVEDDEDTATLIGRMLHLMPDECKRGFTEWVTVEAHSGAQAIDYLNHLPVSNGDTGSADGTSFGIDCVLLDIRLGDMTGFDVLYAMEQNAHLRDVPVCVMSGDVVEVRGGPPITPHLTLACYDGLSTRELGESIAALLKIMLPGARVDLSPTAARQPVELR